MSNDELSDKIPGLSRDWVEDHSSTASTFRMNIDLKGLLGDLEDDTRTLLIDRRPDCDTGLRTMPSEWLGTAKMTDVRKAGLELADLVKVERAPDHDVPTVVDVSLEIRGQLVTYRVQDVSGYFGDEEALTGVLKKKEYVDLKDLVLEVSENLVRDGRPVSGGGTRMVIDLTTMWGDVKGGNCILLVDPGRLEFRTMPPDISGDKIEEVWRAGWRPASLISVKRVEDDEDEGAVVADLTIEVFSRHETYRVVDASGYFASKGDADDAPDEIYEEVGEIIGEVRPGEIDGPPIIDVENLRAFLSLPDGLSEDELDLRVVEAKERIQAQLIRELDPLDRQELWDFTMWLMKACDDAMKKK